MYIIILRHACLNILFIQVHNILCIIYIIYLLLILQKGAGTWSLPLNLTAFIWWELKKGFFLETSNILQFKSLFRKSSSKAEHFPANIDIHRQRNYFPFYPLTCGRDNFWTEVIVKLNSLNVIKELNKLCVAYSSAIAGGIGIR